MLDALLHIGFFVVLAIALAPLEYRRWTLAVLAVLGVTLEIVQWRLGGYARLEWDDITANEAGVALAALVAFVRRNRCPSAPGA